MKREILKPQVTFSRGNVGGILKQNPIVNIGVGSSHYIVQGGFVMYEDGTIVEDPPAAFWTEFAKCSPEIQEMVGLSALTRKPFPLADEKATRRKELEQSTNEELTAKEKAENEARDKAAKEASDRAAKAAEELAVIEAKTLEDQAKLDSDKESARQALEEREAKAAADAAAKEAASKPAPAKKP